MQILKKIVIYSNIGLILALSLAIIYTIWFDKLEDLFWKVLFTYATVVVSSYIMIKYLEYVDKREDREKKK